MGIFDRFLPKQRLEVSLTPLRDAVMEAAITVAARPVAPALITARIADRVREARGEPVHPDAWVADVASLDAAGWQRLAVAGSALSHMPVEPMVTAGVGVQRACALVATETPLLTLDLLRTVRLRAEEFARKLCASAGVAVIGENEATSRAELERLDYARLLAESERAKLDAAERLKQLEALRAQNAPRRGKW